MATSFLSPSEIAICSGLHDQLHATYGRALTLYKTAQVTVASSDPNFIFTQVPTTNNLNYQQTPISGVFTARVFYFADDKLMELFNTNGRADGGQDQLRLLLPKGEVRIKLPIAALPFVQDCQKVILDNTSFVNYRDYRLHGPNGTLQFIDVYLQKTT